MTLTCPETPSPGPHALQFTPPLRHLVESGSSSTAHTAPLATANASPVNANAVAQSASAHSTSPLTANSAVNDAKDAIAIATDIHTSHAQFDATPNAPEANDPSSVDVSPSPDVTAANPYNVEQAAAIESIAEEASFTFCVGSTYDPPKSSENKANRITSSTCYGHSNGYFPSSTQLTIAKRKAGQEETVAQHGGRGNGDAEEPLATQEETVAPRAATVSVPAGKMNLREMLQLSQDFAYSVNKITDKTKQELLLHAVIKLTDIANGIWIRLILSPFRMNSMAILGASAETLATQEMFS
ncbi:hypothetical protein IV203_028633 [Nitzschia inconspicua]|uniref:Uncharacterized protein n=1 Tax=Nitzschia inconspicua TaxID=303405 RepID=A0A9K3LP94_9STRA|nr:hypothetical protein IV203_004718 [Nitzschia inconspicua]KAG7365963.1 hypothetical protein IV203_028633 [Nitzschia inconspicua]